jgi:hypothetical protein
MQRAIAVVVAFAGFGCGLEPPVAPEGESRLQARVEGSEREVKQREAIAAAQEKLAADAEVQAQAAVQEAEADPGLAGAELERRRAALRRAAEWRAVATVERAQASADVTGVTGEKARLKKQQDARMEEWRFTTARSGYRMIVASSVLVAGGFIGCAFGVAELVGRPGITRPDLTTSEADRQADIRGSNRRLAAEFGVGVPLAIAGAVLMTLGFRRLKKWRWVTPTPGGLVMRF